MKSQSDSLPLLCFLHALRIKSWKSPLSPGVWHPKSSIWEMEVIMRIDIVMLECWETHTRLCHGQCFVTCKTRWEPINFGFILNCNESRRAGPPRIRHRKLNETEHRTGWLHNAFPGVKGAWINMSCFLPPNCFYCDPVNEETEAASSLQVGWPCSLPTPFSCPPT